MNKEDNHQTKYKGLWGHKTGSLPYIKLPVCIIAHPDELGIPRAGLQTLLVLIRYYSIKGSLPWVSEATLAKEVKVTPRSVRNHLAGLVQAEVIEVSQRKGMTNLYSLKPLMTKFSGHYCHYSARAVYRNRNILSQPVRKEYSTKYKERSTKDFNKTKSISDVLKVSAPP